MPVNVTERKFAHPEGSVKVEKLLGAKLNTAERDDPPLAGTPKAFIWFGFKELFAAVYSGAAENDTKENAEPSPLARVTVPAASMMLKALDPWQI
jgi:hypothetical protein